MLIIFIDLEWLMTVVVTLLICLVTTNANDSEVYLRVTALLECIIGIYKHEFTNKKQEI